MTDKGPMPGQNFAYLEIADMISAVKCSMINAI